MKRTKCILLSIAAVLVVAFGGYAAALSIFAPDESKLGAWRTDLTAALAEAKATNKLVVVKAGSKY